MTVHLTMMKSCRRAREPVIGPLAAAAIPILGILLFWLILPAHFQANESTDFTDFYRPVARSLLAGDGLVDHNGDP
ncbi:MAG: hypothetical protein GY953_47285, partial [bacterium]|nr:hypothetical protein [bacterium]